MTDIPMHVPAFEHGILRLWSFDGASGTGHALVEAMREEPRDAGAPMAALGAKRIDPYWLDIVALRDIDELGLVGYLSQGYDVPRERLEAAELTTQQDHVLIVPSRAFADHEQTLSPDAALTPLATFDIHQDVGALRPMKPVETARSQTSAPDEAESPPGPPSGRGLRPGAILLLLLIAAAFVLVVAL